MHPFYKLTLLFFKRKMKLESFVQETIQLCSSMYPQNYTHKILSNFLCNFQVRKIPKLRGAPILFPDLVVGMMYSRFECEKYGGAGRISFTLTQHQGDVHRVWSEKLVQLNRNVHPLLNISSRQSEGQVTKNFLNNIIFINCSSKLFCSGFSGLALLRRIALAAVANDDSVDDKV